MIILIHCKERFTILTIVFVTMIDIACEL